MNKRQITLAELEEELRVGTVDLSTLEVIDASVIPPVGIPPQSPDDQNPTPTVAPSGQGDNGHEPSKVAEGFFILPPTADEFLANLAAQADKAIATIAPDLRSSLAASVADGEEIEDVPGSEFDHDPEGSLDVPPSDLSRPEQAAAPSPGVPETAPTPLSPAGDTTVPPAAASTPGTSAPARRPAHPGKQKPRR
jgi:hypothetical protein